MNYMHIFVTVRYVTTWDILGAVSEHNANVVFN